MARLDEAPHGTASGYTNWGCRCLPCHDAFFTPARRGKNREAMRRWYERHRVAS